MHFGNIYLFLHIFKKLNMHIIYNNSIPVILKDISGEFEISGQAAYWMPQKFRSVRMQIV